MSDIENEVVADAHAGAVARGLRAWLDASAYVPSFGLSIPPMPTQGVLAGLAAPPPPWVSKGRVNRAGKKVRDATVTPEDAQVLNAWRAAHAYVINTFQALLRKRTKNQDVAVAQRLKRRVTIIDKLQREPKMELARMDDVAGCRLIFPDIAALTAFRLALHKAQIRHHRRNEIGKYDYIQSPKPLGYRGIHDIYEYDTKSPKGAPYKGLLIEIQYRTKCQHAWATAVELITNLTGHEPKFNRGDAKHIEFFKVASEVIARTCEGLKSCFPDLSDAEVAARLAEIDAEIRVMAVLRRMKPSQETAKDASVLILQSAEDKFVIHEFPNKETATEAYFRLEKEFETDDIVLVTAESFESIRTAYRNYFSDVEEFVRLIDEGCEKLRGAACGG